MMENEIKLSKKQMADIFNEMILYFSNSPYSGMDKDNLNKVINIYYNTLKFYDEKIIRIRLQKYIEKEKFFPKLCDLIPQESDFIENI